MIRAGILISIIFAEVIFVYPLFAADDLIHAVKTGNTILVEELIKQGADVNITDNVGTTPLAEAIRVHRGDLVYLLLESGASPNVRLSNGDSALHLAVQSDLIISKLLLEAGADVNSIDAFCRTPLMIIARTGNRDEPAQAAVKLLLEFGADIKTRDALNRDALSYAMVMDEQMIHSILDRNFRIGNPQTEDERIKGVLEINNYMAMKLVRAGADISGWFEWTQLLKACMLGDLETISRWQNGIFNLDSEDAEGTSAMIVALSNRQVEAAKLLVERGVDIRAKSRFPHRSPLAVATGMCLESVVQILVDEGADLSSSYPLECAIWNENEEIAVWLIQHGISTEPVDEFHGGTPLSQAIVRNMPRTVKALLRAGSDIHWVSRWGDTLLMIAAQSGHDEIVKILLEAGADVNAKNRQGESALEIARNAGHEKVIQILVSALNKNFKN
jgi:ankyrin repeat protein